MRRLFALDGLACAGCARGLERHLRAIPGVRSAGVHFLTSSALIDWDDTRLSPPDIEKAVRRAGYRLIARHRPEQLDAMLAANIQALSVRLAVAVVAGMWSMGLALVLYLGDLPAGTAWWVAAGSGLFALPVVLWSGGPFLWMAARSLRLRTPGMDLLVSTGALGAMILSVASLARGESDVYFDGATMLITLLLLARLVEAWTRRGALTALTAMEAAAPETALRIGNVAANTAPSRVPCQDLNLGDLIRVDAGEVVAMDGIVVAGESRINRAAMTGESRSAFLCPRDRVEAGVVNLSRRIDLRIDRAFGDRDIDRMGGAIAVEIAQRGETQDLTDRMAASLSLAIPALAAATALGGLVAGLPGPTAATRALTVLVGACPCALSLAAPLVHLQAARLAALRGVRIRSPGAFERLARARSAVFDKTGTLTAGHLSVETVAPASGWTASEVLRLAALAETGIVHPIAAAIVAAHGGEAGPGGTRHPRGVEVVLPDGRRVEVMTLQDDRTRDDLTRVDVRVDGVSAGTLALCDTVRADAAEALDELADRGLAIRVATGDGPGPAFALAARLGIAGGHVSHSMTPADKVRFLRGQPRPVLFVGDGVNDGPALAAADCGLSVAGAHPAAVGTADLVVAEGQGLGAIIAAIDLSRATRSAIHLNIALSVAYNILAVPAAMVGLLTPGLAALLMAGSSLVVIAGSLATGSRMFRIVGGLLLAQPGSASCDSKPLL